MPSRRCLLVGGRGGSGAEVLLQQFADEPPTGWETSLVIDPHESTEGARNLTVREILFNRVVHPTIWPLLGLKALEVSDRFELVHLHNHLGWFRRPPSVPVVMTVSGGSYFHYVESYMGWSRERVERLYRRARPILRILGILNETVSWSKLARIGVWSEFAKGYLTRMGVEEARIAVIPPGVPDVGVRPKADGGGAFTFLFAGRDPERKGADLIVRAVRILRERHDVLALLVGDPSFLRLQGEPGFEVAGPVPREVLFEEYYPRADVVLLPSRAEGYGLTVVEGMAAGKAVIVSDQGAFREITGNGRAGPIVRVGDGDHLLEAMECLASRPFEALDYGREGRRLYEERYSIERQRERMAGFYASALNSQ